MTRTCALCSEQISQKRLLAVPHTTLCLACKADRDALPVTAFNKRVARSLASGSISDLDELASAAREAGGLD